MLKKTDIKTFTLVLLMGLLSTTTSYAMHIAEGFLPKTQALIWFIIAAPFVVVGMKSLTKITREHPDQKLMLALSGAFVFLLSSLKLPAMTGSCTHPTGVGLGTILFGPLPMFVLGTITLLFQAILLAHGGLTTLGANVFSMAVCGPIVCYVIYKALKKAKVNEFFTVFLASTIGDLFTYFVTSVQLAIAFPGGNFWAAVGKYMGVFMLTQVPIAIMEGILTVLVYNGVKKYVGGTVYEN